VATIAIIENSPLSGSYFRRALDGEQVRHFTVRAWRGAPLPSDFDACILTGDLHNVTDGLKDYHRREVEFVAGLEGRKAFASCFSHQLIAFARGGKVARRERRLLRWEAVTVEGHHPALAGITGFQGVCMNVDEVTEAPFEAVRLASSQGCLNQLLAYADNILTSQSHPEMSMRRGAAVVRLTSMALSVRDRSMFREYRASEPRPLPAGSGVMQRVIRWLAA